MQDAACISRGAVAEVSNYDIVNHCFDVAADRIELPDDVRAVHALLLPRGAGADPGHARRREDARLLRLSRPAQRRPRPVQGRRPLPPGGRPRRGARAGDADDAGRRRSSASRSAAPRAASTSTAEGLDQAELQQITRSFIDKIEKVLGPHARHPGARRRHQRADDGLDDGRVRQAARPHAGDRDRQADRARGLLRARGGHRPRPRLPVPRGGPGARAASPATRASSSRASATSARGPRGSSPSSAARSSACPTPTARSTPRTGSTPRRCRRTSATAARCPSSRARRRVITPDELLALECEVFVPAALGGMIHEDNAGPLAREGHARGRELADHPEGRRDPRSTRASTSSPT